MRCQLLLRGGQHHGQQVPRSVSAAGSVGLASCACAKDYVVKSGKCETSGWTTKANTVCTSDVYLSGSFTSTTCGARCVGSCKQFFHVGTNC